MPEPLKLKQNKEIATLHRINKFLSCIDDLDKLLQLIMQEALRTVKAQAASIALYDSQQKNLRFTVSLGKKGGEVKEIRLKLGQGIIGYAAQSKKSLNIADVNKDKRFHSDIDVRTKFKTKSILAVPILYKQRLIGALEVINKEGADKFSSADNRLLEIVAGLAAIAIENAKLYQRMLQKHRALKTKHNRLVEMQKQMLRMERMSAIGDLASRIVHDLRNPLTVIRSCAEFFKDPAVEIEERKKWSKVITDEVDRLTGMTMEVMDFAKGKTNLLFQDYPLDDFIREIAAYLERDFQPYNIKLIVESNYRGKVYIDKFKMQRAIFNISFNARDAMLQGGIFKIETNLADTGTCPETDRREGGSISRSEARSEDAGVAEGALRQGRTTQPQDERLTSLTTSGFGTGSMVEIKLMDTGPGIPAEIKDKLGEPFATFGKAHGTGLGIAIVKKIITEVHKGTFSVQSHPFQEGTFTTTFILKIPINKPGE